jgi:diacylglycerol O-acyltransferase
MATIDRLSAQDVQILKLERGRVRGHTCKVIVLEPGEGRPLPTLDDLRDSIAGRLDAAPRLRRRLVRAPLGAGRPAWVDDPAFDIARQVTRLPVDGPVSRSELNELVALRMAERLDRAHPLWHIDLVEPLEDGGAALIWRIHHCMADGTAAAALGSAVLWSEQPDAAHLTSSWRPAPGPAPWRLFLGGASPRPRSPKKRARPSLPSREVLRRELRRTASSPRLAGRVGPARSVAFASAPLTECRRAGKVIDERVTVNDVVLAIVAGGMRTWLEDRPTDREGIRVKVPVSLHRGSEEAPVANSDSYFFVDLPVAEPDPVQRLLAINRQTTERKLHHDAEALYRLGLHRSAARWAMSPHVFTFNVSNVPGPRHEVYVIGARVTELYSLAEIAQHHTLRIAVISAAGMLFFGLCADRDSVTGLDALAAGLTGATEELLRSAG